MEQPVELEHPVLARANVQMSLAVQGLIWEFSTKIPATWLSEIPVNSHEGLLLLGNITTFCFQQNNQIDILPRVPALHLSIVAALQANRVPVNTYDEFITVKCSDFVETFASSKFARAAERKATKQLGEYGLSFARELRDCAAGNFELFELCRLVDSHQRQVLEFMKRKTDAPNGEDDRPFGQAVLSRK